MPYLLISTSYVFTRFPESGLKTGYTLLLETPLSQANHCFSTAVISQIDGILAGFLLPISSPYPSPKGKAVFGLKSSKNTENIFYILYIIQNYS
ncbi:hypothetical protein [Sabulibacter ruber]|uniref:hypothetical protein n=1 Tax=Sabulibacter ruber TaxID=2811901 RepID=UPI001A974A3E|nr:hypothetical protein [Sabulibacter ruber]